MNTKISTQKLGVASLVLTRIAFFMPEGSMNVLLNVNMISPTIAKQDITEYLHKTSSIDNLKEKQT
ncbi:MAG: hypothetical protein ACJAW1_001197 [Glaciecola sp.]|jgi:hypothetical protein